MKKFYLFALLFCLSLYSLTAQVTDVVTGLSNPNTIALYGNSLYVGELFGDLKVVDLTQPLPAPATTVLANLGIAGLLTIGDELYMTITSPNKVVKIDLTDPSPTLIDVATNVPDSYGLYQNGDDLYISSTGNGIYKVDLTAPLPQMATQVLSNTDVAGMAVKDNELFFSNFNGSNIRKIDLTQENPIPEVVISGLSGPDGMTLNGNFLYVSEYSGGRISRIDLGAAMLASETVVTGLSGPSLTAFDGTTLYFAQFNAGKVSRILVDDPVFPTQPTVCLGSDPVSLGGASPTGGVYSGTNVTDNGDGNTFSFDAATAGVGMHFVTYTIDGAMVAGTVTVAESPTVTFSTSMLSVQEDAGVQAGLSGGMPAGGVYSGPGVTDDGNGMTYSFDPAAAVVGENVITYTFTNANTCSSAQSDVITVTPAALPGDLCADAIDIGSLFGQATNEPQLSALYDNTGYTLSGDEPTANNCGWLISESQKPIWFTFTGDGNTYSIASANASTPVAALLYSGTCDNLSEQACIVYSNGNNFDYELPTEAGVQYLLYVLNDLAIPTATFNLQITLQCPDITLTPTLTGVCVDAGVQAGLGGGLPAGGVYSGPGITDDGNGMTFSFDPATAGVGAQTVTYAVTESNIDQEQTDGGSTNGFAGFYQTGLAQSFVPVTSQLCGAGILLESGNDNGEATIELWDDLPIAIGANLLASSTVMATEGDYVDVSWPAVNVISGETYYLVFSGTNGSMGIRGTVTDPYANGQFYANNFGAFPTFDIAFRTFTCSTGTCSGEATGQIEVFALPEVTFVPSISTVALNAGTQSISGGMPVGGVYSGNGVTDDGNGMTFSFDPAAAGVGENVITYTYMDANGCSGTQGAVITVEDCPEITLTPTLTGVCADAGIQAGLGGGLPAGGVYSGPGITDDGNGMTFSFDPATAGVGAQTVTYAVTESNIDQEQTDFSSPTGDFNTDFTRAQSFIPTISQICGAGIYVNTTPTSTDELTIALWDALPNQDGANMLASGSTIVSANSYADVSWLPVDVITGNTYYLVFTSEDLGIGMSGASANPYPDGIAYGSNFYFQVPSIDFTFRTFTCSTGTCSGEATAQIEVFALPEVMFVPSINTVALNAGVQSISGGSPAGGVYSGNGVTDDGNGMTFSFDPAAAGVGENVITYTYMDANGCSGAQGAVITVEDCPDITFTPTLTGVCADAGVQTGLGGGLPAGGVYSGLGITDDGNGMTFSFDPATAGVGAQTMTYAVTESNIDQEQTDNSMVYSTTALQVAQSFIPTTDQICGWGVFITDNGAPNGEVTLSLWDNLPNAPGALMLAQEMVTAMPGNYADVSWPAVTVIPGNTYYLVFDDPSPVIAISGTDTNPYPDGVAYDFALFPLPEWDIAFRTFTCSTGTCSGEATAQIEVFALPEITFVPSISTVALNAGMQSISGGMPVGGVYSGNGATDDGNGMTFSFDPAVAGAGENVITYTYMDANGCSGTQGAVITVEEALPGDVCPDANDINPLFGGAVNEAQISSVQDNTDYNAENDPGIGYECWFDNEPFLHNTIWYAFTGDGEKYGIRSIVCGDNPMPGTDTQFALYSGDCTSPIAVACNDDEDFDNQAYNSYLEIVTEPGVDYLLMVDGYVTVNNPAIGTFCLEVTRLETVSAMDISQTALEVYPNPTTGLIQISKAIAERVEVYDNTGRLVQKYGQATQEVDITSLPSGLYILKMYDDEGVVSARVIKE